MRLDRLAGDSLLKHNKKINKTMKKLLTLSTALLFTAGAAFAQSNDASVSQDGDSNEATIEQIGSDNSAELNQGFDGQGQSNAFATIEQDGTANVASLNQRAWAERGNDHAIEQFGEGNEGTLDIYNGNNSGFLLQDGIENTARMVQSGNENESLIVQEGFGNYAQSSTTAGSGNSTAIVQSGLEPIFDEMPSEGLLSFELDVPILLPSFSEGNAATLSAKGSNNLAGILQLGSFNSAGSNPQWSGDLGIEIEGNGNMAGIGQVGVMNEANIAVMGNANLALIGQFGAENTASIMQDGSGNSAVIVQDGGGFGLPIDDGFPQ